MRQQSSKSREQSLPSRSPVASIAANPADEIDTVAGLCLVRCIHGIVIAARVAVCDAVANDLIEVHLAANLFFEIKLLLRQLVLERGDLSVGQRVLDSDRHLLGDLRKQFHVFFGESVFTAAGYVQCSQRAVM